MSAETAVALHQIQAPDTWVVNPDILERTRQQAVEEKLQRLQTLKPESQFDPQNELELVTENYDAIDRRKGQLVARLSASVNGRHRSENLKYRTLAELGNPLNGFNYGGDGAFNSVVSQLESQRAHRAPLATSLARDMEPKLMPTFASFESPRPA